LKNVLVKMTEMYEKLTETVTAPKDEEYLDFHARRLVESAGHIIAGYMLLHDANKNQELFRRSAEVYVHYGRNEVVKNYNFVTQSRIEDMAYYKPDLTE